MTTFYVEHNETGELLYLGEEEPDNDLYNGEGHFVHETDMDLIDLQENYTWSIIKKQFVKK